MWSSILYVNILNLEVLMNEDFGIIILIFMYILYILGEDGSNRCITWIDTASILDPLCNSRFRWILLPVPWKVLHRVSPTLDQFYQMGICFYVSNSQGQYIPVFTWVFTRGEREAFTSQHRSEIKERSPLCDTYIHGWHTGNYCRKRWDNLQFSLDW